MLPTVGQVLGRAYSVRPMLVTCVTDCGPGARQSTQGKVNVGYLCYRLLARFKAEYKWQGQCWLPALPTVGQVLGRVHSVRSMLVICVTDWSPGARQSTKGKVNVGYLCYRLESRF